MDLAAPATSGSGMRALPPVLGRLLSGTLWLALRVPLQIVLALWTSRLILEAIGKPTFGAYGFAWGFGFFQFLFEFGASSALQRAISEAWTKGNHEEVDRCIACGMNFYGAVAALQMVALWTVAYWALPYSGLSPSSYPFVVKLLWLQIVMAPCFGLSMVVSSVLQAARRYDFVPRLEVASTLLRFLVLWVGLEVVKASGLRSDTGFFWVVVAQVVVQTVLGIGPALWVMVRELGHVPHFRGARWVDYKLLGHFSFYIALIQISVVLADKVDTTVLGFVRADDAESAIAVYQFISKPFLQLRQTGWMLAYLVMPAVASLVAARDEQGLDRIKYDGSRLHVAALLPAGLLAWLYAGPFLLLWIGNQLGYPGDAVAPLMRLFLVAAIPLVLSVPVQMSIGMSRVKVIALAALLGSLVNLPVSCYLAARMGVEGVIWGTILTTLFSNLLVPGLYVFRVLEINPWIYLRRTLSAPLAGACALLAITWLLRLLAPVTYPGNTIWTRALPLIAHLSAGSIAYLAGYLLTPAGRGDLTEIMAKLRRGR
jgi:O-antigen/teichoic acid export membrane protein